MKRNKLLSLLLVGAMTVSMLAGCGSKAETGSGQAAEGTQALPRKRAERKALRRKAQKILLSLSCALISMEKPWGMLVPKTC